MKLAETVTFASSGLDRAAELRGDAGALAALKAADGAGVLALWQGKPMIRHDGADACAVWLPVDSPVLSAAREPLVFLGRDGGAGRFAADISEWVPPEQAETIGSFFDPSEQCHPDAPTGAVFAELRAIMSLLGPRDAELIATAKAVLGWHVSHRFCASCGAASVAVQAGWQRDCPVCGARHFPRTDPVVIMLVTHGNATLLGRAPGWPEGMFSCLAGFVEPGETIEAAVRRETFEEAGVQVGAVDYLSSQPWPFPASLMFGCHGHALGTELVIDPAEIEEAVWVTREEMAAIFAREHPRIRPPRLGAIAHFLLFNWLCDRLD